MLFQKLLLLVLLVAAYGEESYSEEEEELSPEFEAYSNDEELHSGEGQGPSNDISGAEEEFSGEHGPEAPEPMSESVPNSVANSDAKQKCIDCFSQYKGSVSRHQLAEKLREHCYEECKDVHVYP